MSNKIERLKRYTRSVGPGLTTGAANSDPATIATYSVAGASTGYTYLWLCLLSFPFMVVIQDMVARIGNARREGLGKVISSTFGRRWLTAALAVVVISNVTTIAADLAGVAAGIELVTHVHRQWFVVPIGVLILYIQVFRSYRTFAKVLKYLTIPLLAYIAAGILARPDWIAVAEHSFIPHISPGAQGLAIMLGIPGTTLSPYMFFWYASQQVEEIRQCERTPEDPRCLEPPSNGMFIDTASGLFYSTIVFAFVIITCAATLYREGIEINNAADAARTLAPIAGRYASLLFSIGIIGSGLLAIPILAASTAYPIAEWLGHPVGLDEPWGQARWFYVVLTASVIIGTGIALLPISPIDALFYSQVLIGMISPVLLVMITLIARNRNIMHGKANTPAFNAVSWFTVAFLIAANLALLWTVIRSILPTRI